MSQSFKAEVNNTYTFDFDVSEVKKLDVIEQTNNQFHVLENNQSFDAKILQKDFNKKIYTVQVNGNLYEVKISDELDMLISDLGLEASAEKRENDLKAPMPGLIVSIDIEIGQEVAEGDGILVLEAMKMENTLTAPRTGVIKSIEVQVGDKVEKNMVLIEME